MGIWEYMLKLNKKIDKKYQIDLTNGNTPCPNCPNLAKELNLKKLYLKREDKNETGSFKDRSISWQISSYLAEGKKHFLISSSGNAAISAISCLKDRTEKLEIFLSVHTPESKLERISELLGEKIEAETKRLSFDNITLHISEKPKSDCIKKANTTNAVNLRGSVDDRAIEGFKTIAFELRKQAPDTDSIFIPTSSGTSTLGIFSGYNEYSDSPPQMHIVQTERIHPIAKEFDTDFETTHTSLAMAISDRVAHRKDEVITIVKQSQGSGWTASDNLILKAKHLLEDECNVEIGYDACLSLAGLLKALDNGWKLKRPTLILSGK